MLDATRLSGKIKQAYLEVDAMEGNREDALEAFCDKLAACFVEEMKEMKINYTGGLTAPNGAVGGTINHTVS